MAEALKAGNIIQIITLSIKGGSQTDSVLELLASSGVLLLQKVVKVLVLSLLVLVNLGIIGNNLNKADVLVVDFDSCRTRAFKLHLEDQFLLGFFLLIIFITVFLFPLFGVNRSLFFHVLVIQ